MTNSEPPSPAKELDLSLGGPEKTYQVALAAGNFVIQRCESCLRHVFFPRLLCTHCGSDRLDWRSPSGLATVYSTTTVRRKTEDGGDHNVSLVNLAEGPRLMTRIEDIPVQDIKIGMQVRAEVRAYNGANVLIFVPFKEK